MLTLQLWWAFRSLKSTSTNEKLFNHSFISCQYTHTKTINRHLGHRSMNQTLQPFIPFKNATSKLTTIWLFQTFEKSNTKHLVSKFLRPCCRESPSETLLYISCSRLQTWKSAQNHKLPFSQFTNLSTPTIPRLNLYPPTQETNSRKSNRANLTPYFLPMLK